MKYFPVCYQEHNWFDDQYGVREETGVAYFETGCAVLLAEAEKFHKIYISWRNLGGLYRASFIQNAGNSIKGKLVKRI